MEKSDDCRLVGAPRPPQRWQPIAWVNHGGMLPRLHGFAYRSWNRDAARTAVIPLNIIIRMARAVMTCLRAGGVSVGLESRDAYLQGLHANMRALEDLRIDLWRIGYSRDNVDGTLPAEDREYLVRAEVRQAIMRLETAVKFQRSHP